VKSLKWSPIVGISSEVTRGKDWEDVVSMHEGEGFARTWRLQEKKAGRWALEMDDGVVSVSDPVLQVVFQRKNEYLPWIPVQAVCTSACGNYALAGSSTGQIKLWNLQSGQQRKTYQLEGVPAPVLGKGGKKVGKVVKGKKTGSSVTGLYTDALNTVLVASTLDGKLSVSPGSIMGRGDKDGRRADPVWPVLSSSLISIRPF
jgi:U3 small nucleolar RNA-associated protein 21